MPILLIVSLVAGVVLVLSAGIRRRRRRRVRRAIGRSWLRRAL